MSNRSPPRRYRPPRDPRGPDRSRETQSIPKRWRGSAADASSSTGLAAGPSRDHQRSATRTWFRSGSRKVKNRQTSGSPSIGDGEASSLVSRRCTASSSSTIRLQVAQSSPGEAAIPLCGPISVSDAPPVESSPSPARQVAGEPVGEVRNQGLPGEVAVVGRAVEQDQRWPWPSTRPTISVPSAETARWTQDRHADACHRLGVGGLGPVVGVGCLHRPQQRREGGYCQNSSARTGRSCGPRPLTPCHRRRGRRGRRPVPACARRGWL